MQLFFLSWAIIANKNNTNIFQTMWWHCVISGQSDPVCWYHFATLLVFFQFIHTHTYIHKMDAFSLIFIEYIQTISSMNLNNKIRITSARDCIIKKSITLSNLRCITQNFPFCGWNETDLTHCGHGLRIRLLYNAGLPADINR